MSEELIDKVVSAAQFGDFAFVKEAVSGNRDVASAADANGCSVLHWACINNRRAIVHYLMDNGANINHSGGRLNEIPIQWAVRNEKYGMLVQYLIENGSNLAHKGVGGMDTLHVAIRAGSVKMAFLVLSAGAYVDSVDGNGDTSLHWCLKNQNDNDNFEIIRMLLSCGADALLRDGEGNNVFHLLIAHGRTFNDARLALSITEKAQKAGKNVGDALFYATNLSKQTPYKVAVRRKNTYMMRFLWDIFLYRNAPSFLPTLSIACTTATPFFAVYFFNFTFFTLFVIVLSMFLFEKISLPTFFSSRSGLAWGIIVTAEWSYFLNVAQHFSLLVNIAIVINCTLICVTLYLSEITKANSLLPDQDRQGLVAMIAAAGLEEGPTDPQLSGKPFTPGAPEDLPPPPPYSPKLCATCLIDKSKATMHCSKCDICVVGLDHHCPFVNNCVGRGNRRIFVLFCFSAATGCLVSSILSFIVQHTVTCPDEKGMLLNILAVQLCVQEKNPFFSLVPWLALLTSVWIWLLFTHQIWMVAASTTTFDIVRGLHDGSGNNCSVSCRNIKEFCKTGQFQIVPKRHDCSSGTCSHSGNNSVSESGIMGSGSLMEGVVSKLSSAVAPIILGDTGVKEERVTAVQRERERERDRENKEKSSDEEDPELGVRARLLDDTDTTTSASFSYADGLSRSRGHARTA